MLVSVGLPTSKVEAVEEFGTAEALTEMSIGAEQAGFDGVWVTDHPFPSVEWVKAGRGGHHTLDPFVALTVAAAQTTQIRLQTHIYVLPYRNALLTAKQAATLDVISSGRLTLGVGAGHLKAEFAALGVDHSNRQQLTGDAIVCIRAAWTEENIGGNVMLPRPNQHPGPPIWVGGNSPRAIRHAVELGDGWAPMPNPSRYALGRRSPALESVSDLESLLAGARDHAALVGRTDSMDIVVMPFTGPLVAGDASAEEIVDHIGQLARAGATYLVANVPGGSRKEFLDNLSLAGQELLPRIAEI